MKLSKTTPVLLFLLPFVLCFTTPNHPWKHKNQKRFTLFFTSEDESYTKEYRKLVTKGIKTTKTFFKSNFVTDFEVYVHPNRASLDSTWQKDWAMPEFKSECWMVASGVAKRLDVISPKKWNTESCEHNYENELQKQQLITHELIHVYHGQQNKSPDFSDTDNIDWFVEGLATYASGQCDKTRIDEVKKLITEDKQPKTLNNFWKGKSKYGISGSMAMFIDFKYGRTKINALLKFNNATDILNTLNTTESDLIKEWKNYMLNKT